MTAAGNVESVHVFCARALQIGLQQPVIDLFVGAGFGSFGKFAWSCAYTPGGVDETSFLDMVRRTLTRDPTDGELAVLRRLFFESHAVSLQDMRSRIDRSTDSAPTKIQPAEKAARYQDQVGRLVGLNLTGPLECSYQLIDAVFSLVEENTLKYLPIYSLTSREQEMLGEKEDADLKEYAVKMKSGTLVAQEVPNLIKADLGTDLKIRFALQRRALAFDQAALISWTIHDRWIALLFHRMAEAPMHGYYSVTMEQCLRADRRLFLKMSEQCRANINAVMGQPRPLDVAMDKYIDHSDILYLLNPLAIPVHTIRAPDKGDRVQPYAKSKGGKDKGAKASGKQGKSKGSGKKGKANRGKGEYGPPPGCISRTADGRNICHSFNRPGGCINTNTELGKSCVRGYHICGKEGCHKDHPSYDCPSSFH